MAASLRLGLVGLVGLLVPLWWTWLVGVVIYGFLLVAGSPAQPPAGFGTALVFVPSGIVGLTGGTVTALLSDPTPVKGWFLFVGCAVLGMLTVALGSSSLDAANEALRDIGTWVFVGASFAPALFVRLKRKRDG